VKVYPDGIKSVSLETIPPAPGPSQLQYELCGGASGPLSVELEQCLGHTTLLACPDDSSCSAIVATRDSWAYYSDDVRTCSHSFAKKRDFCSPTALAPTLLLPQRAGNYFVTALGPGVFTLRVSEMDSNGRTRAPRVVLTGLQTATASQVTNPNLDGSTHSNLTLYI